MFQRLTASVRIDALTRPLQDSRASATALSRRASRSCSPPWASAGAGHLLWKAVIRTQLPLHHRLEQFLRFLPIQLEMWRHRPSFLNPGVHLREGFHQEAPERPAVGGDLALRGSVVGIGLCIPGEMATPVRIGASVAHARQRALAVAARWRARHVRFRSASTSVVEAGVAGRLLDGMDDRIIFHESPRIYVAVAVLGPGPLRRIRTSVSSIMEIAPQPRQRNRQFCCRLRAPSYVSPLSLRYGDSESIHLT